MRRGLRITLPLLAVLVGLFGWLVLRLPGTSAVGPVLAFIPYTPENTARRAACGFSPDGPATPRNFRILATYRVPGRVLVVYVAECPPGNVPEIAGPVVGVAHAHAVSGAAGLVAYEVRSSGFVDRLPSPNEPLVPAGDGRQGWGLAYGWVSEPRVHAVEVDFDDGSTMRDEVTGPFSFLSRSAGAACEARALDANGDVLSRACADELAGGWLLGPGEVPSVNKCPP